MKYAVKLVAVVAIIGLAGCGPTKWDTLREAEHQNRVDIRLYCDATPPNARLCARAKSDKHTLVTTRAQYVKQKQEACKRAWAKYDRNLADYDRELTEYDRELERHDREKERKERQCDREQDRYDRAMDRYHRCQDRQTSGSYTYCSHPTIPFCISSISYRPPKPSKPRRPSCTP